MKCDEMWSTYEANLQSYRSIFLSSQSIMLAIGAIMAGESFIITILISIIALFQIGYIWIPVIHYRALLVDFHKYSLEEKFNCDGDFLDTDKECRLTETIYCKRPEIRKKVNDNLREMINEPLKNMRDTRRKIDITLPISMFIVWIIYIVKSLVDSGIIQLVYCSMN